MFDRSHGRCRIIEAPVDPFRFARKDRTAFFRVVADGNDVIELLICKLVNRFGAMIRDVDAYFTHYLYSLCANMRWSNAGAFDIEVSVGNMTK